VDELTLASEEIYRGRVVSLRVDEVRLPGGLTRKREIVELGGAVTIVAVDEHRRVLMVRQFRKPIEQVVLELPAGGLEPGELPELCANRELLEETGFMAAHVERLLGFWSAPGFCTEYMHVFVATGLRAGAATPEEDETIEVVAVSLADVPAMIARGEIADAKSIVGLLAYLSQPKT